MEPNVARRTAPQPTPQLRALLDTMDINQLLDVAIERLRTLNAASPSPTAAAPVRPMAIPLVPISPAMKGRSGS